LKIYNFINLTKEEIETLCCRQANDDALVAEQVKSILSTVKAQGDAALFSFNERFDGVKSSALIIGEEMLAHEAKKISSSVKNAIDTAYRNIYTFHQAQLRTEERVMTMPGVNCWRENRPVEKVGLYIPGGTAILPSTFLMLGIPARIAGCREIVVCSPARPDAEIDPCIAYVATLLSVRKIYRTGGAQAIAAMAYGTESIPRVDKIFGPGNRYVTEAKKQLQPVVAIDMPAGPSEVLIVADDTANPAFVAADLLAQAEHGTDSQAILVSPSTTLIMQIQAEIERQLASLPRKALATKALENSYIIQTENMKQAMEFSNAYAPEHLILATSAFEKLIPLISSAGSVFLGNLTPESAGDYASGTNHTLPTGGFARAYSGVSVDTFLKKITFQHLNTEGLQHIGPTVEILAAAEGLEAHKNAISIRLAKVRSSK